jgi:hypothetical protein
MANSICYHISNLTYELKIVDRIVLNFKTDKNGRIWFLWCSALRLKAVNPKPLKLKFDDISPVVGER